MNRKLSLFILLILPLSLFSCKKCYECEKPEYCVNCIATVGEYTVPLNNCFPSEEERTTAREAFESSIEFAGGTTTCFETKNVNGSGKFCENKKNRDAELQQWKELGYTCSEQ